MKLTEEQLLSVVATPTRLGKYLAPKLWGPGNEYQVDPWLELFEQRALDAILDREHQRFLRLHVPPQVGKTSYSAGFLLFWVLGMFPETRIILITYSDDYSRVRGQEVREMVRLYGHLFGIAIDPDKEASGDWKLKGHRGGMLSVGIGSQIAGRSGDLVIVDDVIKNMQEAASVVTKDLHRREFRANIRPRLQPGGTLIITNTRWADDDIAGWIESREKEPGYKGEIFEAMSHPAIAEPGMDEIVTNEAEWRDVLGRRIGQPLQCRFTDPSLPWEQTIFYSLRDTADDLLEFSCVFQQNPINREGGMFPPDKWQYYRKDELPKMRSIVRVWDPAATEGGGDWSVALKMGRGEDDNFYILDVWRDRLAADQVLERAVTLARMDGSECDVGVEQEKAGAGKGTVRFWEIRLAKEGIRVFAAKPDGSKEERAKPASTLQQGGYLRIPHPDQYVEWQPRLVDQAMRIMGDGRRGRHDDIVDAMAHAVLKLMDREAVQLWDPSTAEFDAAPQSEVLGWIQAHVSGMPVRR